MSRMTDLTRPALADTLASENAIRARRKLTNKLIKGRDAGRLKPFFTSDALVIAGDGSPISGANAIIRAFEIQFAEPGFEAFVRETSRVEIADDGERAAEHGTWTGTWRPAPPLKPSALTLSGPYLATWKKVIGQWVIENEVFVTVRTEGA